MRSPVGVTFAKIQYQTAPLGGRFQPWLNPIQTYPTSLNSIGSGSFRTIPINLADKPVIYLWRAKIKYNSITSPYKIYSPWSTLAGNELMETDLISRAGEAPNPPGACSPSDEPCWLYSVVKVGTDITLNWQDPNQENQRTGWKIRRSNNASLLKDTWPLVGSNVVDMDQSTPNYQWTDHSGDAPGPGGVWYYQVTTYNLNCPAKGPF